MTDKAAPPSQQTTSSIEDQIRLREGKAAQLKSRGVDPWGNGTRVEHCTRLVRERHADQKPEELEAQHTPAYSIAGRVMAVRSFGKSTFVSLRDRDGDLQVYVKKDKVGDAAYEALKLLDLGDLAYARGRAFKTKTGELSLEAGSDGQPGAFKLLTKALRPLPEKWHGLSDVETRYRQRYVDLAVNLEVREAFRKRARLISCLRRFLDEREYVEVETPVLHKPEEAGGAAARPFETHHNALDLDLKMRIATELHLKRLIVGGFERVYEVGRIFRNEGIDRRHNPEFTSVEFYQAYATYEDLMHLTEQLISRMAQETCGGQVLPFAGVDIDFHAPWPRVSMLGEVVKLVLPEAAALPASQQLDQLAALPESHWARFAGDREAQHKLARISTTGERIAWAFEVLCEKSLPADRPCFVVDFPLEVSPLARKRDGEPRLVDRFEAYAGGMEIANAFSELNDPRDQEARFRAQVELAAKGDHEAMPYDRDFIQALEFGMPPTAGEGIGIDRLAMLFTNNASIRDVILFPLLKPLPPEETGEQAGGGEPA
jgi:lysyl-tRNA synthetase class 2